MAGNIITAVATLLGVGMTLTFTTAMRRQDRRDSRLDKEREALVEVLTVGREWLASLDGLLLGAAIQPDMVTFTKSWSFETFGPLNKAFPRALLAGRLLVTDAALSRHLALLSEVVPHLSRSAGAVQESSAKNSGRADLEIYAKAAADSKAFDKGLDRLEELARVRLLPEPGPGATRWVRKILGFGSKKQEATGLGGGAH